VVLASIKAAPALSETQSTHRQKPEFSGFFLILSLLVARVSFDSKRPRRNQTGGVLAAAVYLKNQRELIGLAGFDRGVCCGKPRRRNAVRRTRHIIKANLFKE
jgi:hypothetical protein